MALALSTKSSNLAQGVLTSLFRYWFRPGGEISLAVVRIAVFLALKTVLLVQFPTAEAVELFVRAAQPDSYVPKGILKLLGPLPFSAEFMSGIWWVAYVGCLSAIVGFLTRPAMILASLSTLVLTSFGTSFQVYWSHGYNVNHLAALAFMFAPAGASLSIDRILTRLLPAWPFGRPAERCGYYWPLLLSQFAVALFYFGAAWAKFYNGGLHWVIGDNMRIMVGITWNHPYYFKEPTWLIAQLLNNKLLWQAAAVVHLFSQILPMTAMFFVRRPAVRFLEGMIFLSGIYGLYYVMAVWNPQWLLLTAVFVDWEWVAATLRRWLGQLSAVGAMFADRLATVLRPWILPESFVFGVHGGTPDAQSQPVRMTADKVIKLAGISLFIGYGLWVPAFQSGEKHLNYPFSSFAFYSTVYALPPYDTHRHFTFLVGGIRVRTDGCESIKGPALSKGETPIFDCRDGLTEYDRRRRFNNALHEQYRANTVPGIEAAIRMFIEDNEIRYPGSVPDNARIELLARLWQYPPYPARLEPAITFEAFRGVRLPDGRILAAVATMVPKAKMVQAVQIEAISGFRKPVVTIYGYKDPWYSYGKQPRTVLPGRWLDDRAFEVDLRRTGHPLYTTIGIKEEGMDEEFEFWGPILYGD
jgi:hypothetical protein